MKKVVCLIAVLALTVTVCAQDITITASADGDMLTIGYDASGAAAMPVGISLIVDCGAGEVTSAGDADFSIDSFFDVFIDSAADDPAAYQAGADPATGVLAGAHGLAKSDAAGAAAFPATIFAISAAELADPAGIPAVGTICTLKVSNLPATVCFSADTLRGEVVDVNGDPMTVTLPECIPMEVIPDECLKSDAPEYAAWEGVGKPWSKPDCWCYRRQCRGDIDGVPQGAFPIFSIDFTAFKDAFGKLDAQMTGNRICADLDHAPQGAFRVFSVDFTTFKLYFGKLAAQVPQCDLNGDGVLEAGDKYNFWTN